jgi:hypothetical protein
MKKANLTAKAQIEERIYREGHEEHEGHYYRYTASEAACRSVQFIASFPRKREPRLFPSKFWMPACAGMTILRETAWVWLRTY